MSKTTIICQSCRKAFDADDTLERAFCVYCGAENHLMPKSASDSSVSLSALPTDPQLRKKLLEQLAGSSGPEAFEARDRLLFWPARFEAVDRHATRYGDKFVELLTILTYFSANYPSRGSQKRAVKERDRIFSRPALVKAMTEASHPLVSLEEEFFDAAVVYFLACRDDKHYGSKLFDLVRLKDEDIARKAANDVAVNMMGYLCQIGLVPQSEVVIRALHRAWPTVFRQFPDFLDEFIQALPDDIRTTLVRILSQVPLRQERLR